MAKRPQKASHPRQPNIQQMLDDAVQFRKAGQLPSAGETLSRVLDVEPNHPEALHMLGVLALGNAKYGLATEFLAKAVAAKPDYAKAHNNLGLALQGMGRLDDAVASYGKAVDGTRMYPEASFNMGNALKELERLDEAIACYGEAIASKPDFPEAHNNLGLALKAGGRFEDAVGSYNNAVTLNPYYAAAHNNLGLVFQELGRLDAALQHFLKAIELQPESDRRCSHLRKVLKIADDEDRHRVIEKICVRAPVSPEPELLAYSLSLFRPDEGAEDSYRDAVRKLPSMAEETATFQRQAHKDPTEDTAAVMPLKIVALLQWGRGGTGFIHSLFDGHPKISTIPGICLTGFFGREVWKEISSPEREEAVRRFSELYDMIFDVNSPRPIPSDNLTKIRNFGPREGYTRMGEGKDRSLELDRSTFEKNFNGLLAGREKINRADFFKLMHVAFERTLQRHPGQDLIFYHIHNPENYELLNYLRHCPHSKLLLPVRDPVQSCESWLSLGAPKESAYEVVVDRTVEFLFKFDQVIFHMHDSRGVRLEDISRNASRTIASLCQWLEIEEDEALRSSTFQGLKWWGDSSTIRFGRTEPVGGFVFDESGPESDPLKREIGHLFSDGDRLILGTLLYPVRVLYGYAERDDAAFEKDLTEIRPMLDEPFDFEKKIFDEFPPDHPEPGKNAHYLFLRSALKDRWNILDQNGTYPNMIQPLSVS